MCALDSRENKSIGIAGEREQHLDKGEINPLYKIHESMFAIERVLYLMCLYKFHHVFHCISSHNQHQCVPGSVSFSVS